MSSKRVFSPSATTHPTKPPKRTKVSRKSDLPLAVAKTPEMKSPDKKLAQYRDQVIFLQFLPKILIFLLKIKSFHLL